MIRRCSEKIANISFKRYIEAKNLYPLSTDTTQPVITGAQPQMGKVEIILTYFDRKI